MINSQRLSSWVLKIAVKISLYERILKMSSHKVSVRALASLWASVFSSGGETSSWSLFNVREKVSVECFI